MRWKPLFTIVLLIVCSVVSGAEKTDPGLPSWGEPVEGCRVAISTDKQEYGFAEPIHVHVLVQNTGRDKLRFVRGDFLPCHLDILAPNGLYSPLTLWGQSISVPHIQLSEQVSTLSRSEIRSFDFDLVREMYDMTLPGKYVITASQIIPSDIDPNAQVAILSNTVWIEIKPDR